MGLDMYLSRKTYVKNWSHMNKEERHATGVKLGGKKHPYIDPKKISNIEEEMAYWRKANQIHKWFVDNVQNGVDDCEEYFVDVDQLKELYDLCVEIKEFYAANGDKELQKFAEQRLPTQSGFFFGNTDYFDDGDYNYYMSDIESTIKQLEPIFELQKKLQENEDNGLRNFDYPYYYYRSSW